MTKSFFVLFLCTLCTVGLYAEDFGNEEVEFARIEKLYNEGYYPEVISEGEEFVAETQRKSKNVSLVLIKTKALLAKTHYTVYSFSEAQSKIYKLIEVLDTLPTGNFKSVAYLFVVDYFVETEDFALANKYLNNCTFDFTSDIDLYKIQYLLFKSKILTAQNYFTKAQATISNTDSLIFKIPVSVGDKVSQLSFLDKLNKFKAENWVLKINLIKTRGDYKYVDSLKVPHFVFKNYSNEYSKFIECRAEIYKSRLNFKKALSEYKHALFVLSTSEYHKQQINLTLKISNLSKKLGDIATFEQSTRHLQMYADRNINKYSGYPVANYVAQLYNLYEDLEFESVKKQIIKFKSKYNKIPSNHFVVKQLLELYQIIISEESESITKNKLGDTLSVLNQLYVGDHPSYFNCKLTEMESKGVSFELAKANLDWLNANNSQYLPKEDSISVLNFKYLTLKASMYFVLSDYTNAKLTIENALKIAEKLYGVGTWEYELCLLDYIKYNIVSGNYSPAILTQYNDVKNLDLLMQKSANKYKYDVYCVKASELARLMGDFDFGKSLTNKVVKHSFLNQHINFDLEQSIAVLEAQSFLESGNMSMANKILTQTYQAGIIKYGAESPRLLSIILGLADLNIIIGNYSETENLIDKCFQILEATNGDKLPIYAQGLLIKARYYEAIGDLVRSKDQVEKALKLQKAIYGSKNHNLAETQIYVSNLNLALLSDKLSTIEISLISTGILIETTIGKNNNLYVKYLEASVKVYIVNKNYEKALLKLDEAEKYWSQKYGAKNVHNADLLMQRGFINFQMSKYDEAEKLYEQAKNMYATLLGSSHPSYNLALAKLGKVNYMLHNLEKSLELMEDCMQRYLKYVAKNFSNLSFQEKSKFWASMKDEFEFYNFLIISSGNSKLYGNVYNNVLTTKGLLLTSDIKLRKQISSSKDSVLIKTYNDWVVQKELYASVLFLPKAQVDEQGLNLVQIQSKLEQLEKKMGERSETFLNSKNNYNYTWKDVSASLKPNETAVEMVRFRYFDKEFKDSVLYAALILTNNSSVGPEVVLLRNAKSMENKYYRYFVNAVVANIDDRYSYNTFWGPIKEKIADSSVVYFSSEGIYNQINLEMIKQMGSDKYALDINKFVYVTTTKDIIPIKSTNKSNKQIHSANNNSNKIVVCGNPKFYSNSSKVSGSVVQLNGAENEAKDLVELLKAKNKSAELYIGSSVTEEMIASTKNPLILHIATHGYFKDVDMDKATSLNSNPLFNSGLLLTGAGDILSNTENSTQKGILTAYEAMDMDLDQTEMVVLSACETGKGKVQIGEGVMGLQRSFLVAGAQCVILSLFKVNDQITHDLMLKFYENWTLTNNRRQAFIDAKKFIKEKYNSPIAWGAFVMIEGRTDK